MYATIRRYRTNAAEAESSSELVQEILEGFVPLVRETVAAYYVVDAGDGVIASISICENEGKVRTSNRIAAEWVKQHLERVWQIVLPTASVEWSECSQ
jgi:hypothetical protein